MTKEEEFLFYRNELSNHLANMFYIRNAVTYLMGVTVILPREIRDAIGHHVHIDSSWEEEEEIDALTEWYDHAPQLPLFDEEGFTLTLLSGEIVDEHHSTSRNTVYHVRAIMQLSKLFDTIFTKKGGPISFDGFTAEEVDEIITAARLRAEAVLEKVRDIHTHVNHYMPTARLGIHSALHPDFDAIRVGDPQPDWYNPIVFCSAWWDQATDPDLSDNIMEQLAIILKYSAPPSNHPQVITHFGSNVSNRLDYLNLEGRSLCRHGINTV